MAYLMRHRLPRMRIAVVGAGAIGTWIGAALAHAGHDVALLARGAHREAIERDGVRLTGAEELSIRVPVSADGPVDAVILAVKAQDLPSAADTVARLLGPDTPIVAAQN